MIVGVVLAAGESKRMGEIKQLLDWQGEPVLRQTVRNACSGGFDLVRVVLGANAEKIEPILYGLDVEIIYNSQYRAGQSTSVKYGLGKPPGERIGGTFRGVAFIPGDMPLIKAETFAQMIALFRKEEPGILVPTYEGERGNPVFFHSRFFDELLRIEGDRGGREVIRRYPGAVSAMAVGDLGILQDIDSPEDYQRLKENFGVKRNDE